MDYIRLLPDIHSEGARTPRQQVIASAALPLLFSIRPHILLRGSMTESPALHLSLCTHLPLPDTLDGVRLPGEQVSRPPSGSTSP